MLKLKPWQFGLIAFTSFALSIAFAQAVHGLALHESSANASQSWCLAEKNSPPPNSQNPIVNGGPGNSSNTGTRAMPESNQLEVQP